MLLSMLLSFLLAKKFTGKIYVLLMTIFLTLISLFSMGLPSLFRYQDWGYMEVYELKYPLPLSFPFYASVQSSPYWPVHGPPRSYYLLHFLTFEIVRGYVPTYILEPLYLYYSFFLLVNIVGAIIGYWISKSTILERLRARRSIDRS